MRSQVEEASQLFELDYFGEKVDCMCGSRGGTGGSDSLKTQQNRRFLSNSGPDPMKNYIATKPAFNVGP